MGLRILIHLAVLSATIYALSRFMPGVRVKRGDTSIVVAVVFAVLNWALGWIFKGLLLVPTILTLGLLWFFVPFIVNTIILWITDKLLDDFELKDVRALLYSAGAITLANGLLQLVMRRL